MKAIPAVSRYGRSHLFAFALALCLFPPAPAAAQAVYGSVLGTVMDIAGRPISGATITVTSIEKGDQQRTTSDTSGLFTITHLLSDSYNVRAEAPGCKSTEVPAEEVHADQSITVNFRLEQGAGQTKAKPAQASSLLKTDRADVSVTLPERDVQDLPNFTRNFTAFELLVPGAVMFPTTDNTTRPNQNPQQGLQIDQNGQHYGGSAFQLDGTDNRDPIAGIIVINPPLESVSEIKITTQNFDAEFGQALAGLVTAQTRSGSNTWHGSLFDFRNTDWGEASRPNLLNANATQNNPFKINQFGGSAGGPIIANRLFIFGDYQGNRRGFVFTKFANVPTATARSTCLFPTTPGEDCNLADYGKSLNCPTSSASGITIDCQPFSGMSIPAPYLSPQAVALLQLLPPPNTGTPTQTVQNYQTTGLEPWNDDEFDVRVDQNVSSKLKLFGRNSFFDSRLNADGVFGNLLGGTGISGDNFAGNSHSRNDSVSAGFDYVLSPNLITDFRFGFYRYHVNVFQGGLNTTPATAAGIMGLNLGDPYTSGMPGIAIQEPTAAVTTTIALGYSQPVNNCNCPLLENEQQFQWANNWTKIHGSHTFKWGADFRYAQNLRITSDRHRSGDFIFSPQTAGLGLASFLLGYASSFDRYVDPNNDFSAGERQHRYFFYGQDTWRVNPRFTFTYGLRWEIYLPQSVTGAGQGGFVDLNTGMIDVAGEGATNLHGNVRNDFTDFAPRVGFAYQFTPHSVLRAAYGRSFDLGSLGAVFGDSVTQNPPVLEYEQFLAQSPGQVVYDLRQNAPVIPIPQIANGQINFNGVNNIAINVVPSRIQVPTIDAWNVSVQHQFNSSTSLDLAYVANKATHIFPEESSNGLKNASYNLNQATIHGYVDTTNPQVCEPGTGSGTSGSPCVSYLYTRQPYFSEFKWEQGVNYFGDNASSTYESMQVQLDKRFSHGFSFDAAYTWSKGAGYVEDYFDIDPRVNYGPNDFDRTHAFTLSTLWDLPVGRGRPLVGNAGSLLNRIVGGWALNTISYVYSGLPFTPTYNSNECSADVDTGPCRPNLVGHVEITGNRNAYFTTVSATCFDPNSFFSPGPACGPWQRPARGVFGSAGRNSLRGPDFFDTDLAVLKTVALTERYTLQFRGQVFNLFNRVNLGLPNACIDCPPVGGVPTAAVITNLAAGANMRQLQFALRLQF